MLPWVAAVLVIAGLLIGYSVYRRSVQGKQEAECALVIDRTSSSSQAATVKSYQALAGKTIAGCKTLKAGLSIYYFDEASSKLVLLNRDKYTFWAKGGTASTQAKAAQGKAVQSEVDRATNDLVQVFSPASSAQRGSDIVTALHGVAENLQHDANASGVQKKYLVILTDGLQTSDDVNLSSLASDNSPVAPLVERVKQLALIPALADTQVSFIGVRSGVNAQTGEQLPGVFESKVQEFWTDVVRAGAGRLCTYVPDATLVPVGC